MRNNLYVTADQIGSPGCGHGGSLVTFHEFKALKSLGACEAIDRQSLLRTSIYGTFIPVEDTKEPWYFDAVVSSSYNWSASPPLLCHGYAGTFGKTTAKLKQNGCKVTWTIAAHDRRVSREEHEKLSLPFVYYHLVEESLWRRYVEGYRLADVLICPGTVPERTIRDYGPDFQNKRIEIIPHGCDLSNEVQSTPKQFTVGYLGSCGAPDKGVRYLLAAWKALAYRDAVLVLAGHDSTSDFVTALVRGFGGGNVLQVGPVGDINTFYQSLSLLIQPSATEGFGIPVLEAMANGRPALCSEGAGACDVVPEGLRFSPCDPNTLASKIDAVRTYGKFEEMGLDARETARQYTWDKVRARYVRLWEEILA